MGRKKIDPREKADRQINIRILRVILFPFVNLFYILSFLFFNTIKLSY